MTRPDPLANIPDEQLRPPERIRPVQYFSSAYLHRCRRLSTDDIVRFLEEFRLNCATAPRASGRPTKVDQPRQP